MVLEPATRSFSAQLWAIIVALWPWWWILIILALAGWITVEILTRNGALHYNSENGFSPAFNRFVGAGTYLGLQGLLFALFHWVFGDMAYCLKWPYAVHAVVFLSSGLLLNLTGFWVYLKEPGGRRKYRLR